MTMRRSIVNDILKIAKRHNGVIYWEDGYGQAPMKFRYRFVFQKTQFKCFYEFIFNGKWSKTKICIIAIPYSDNSLFVSASYKDTLIITQLYAHLKELGE